MDFVDLSGRLQLSIYDKWIHLVSRQKTRRIDYGSSVLIQSIKSDHKWATNDDIIVFYQNNRLNKTYRYLRKTTIRYGQPQWGVIKCGIRP